jgi:hypothetical protein
MSSCRWEGGWGGKDRDDRGENRRAVVDKIIGPLCELHKKEHQFPVVSINCDSVVVPVTLELTTVTVTCDCDICESIVTNH